MQDVVLLHSERRLHLRERVEGLAANVHVFVVKHAHERHEAIL